MDRDLLQPLGKGMMMVMKGLDFLYHLAHASPYLIPIEMTQVRMMGRLFGLIGGSFGRARQGETAFDKLANPFTAAGHNRDDGHSQLTRELLVVDCDALVPRFIENSGRILPPVSA